MREPVVRRRGGDGEARSPPTTSSTTSRTPRSTSRSVSTCSRSRSRTGSATTPRRSWSAPSPFATSAPPRSATSARWSGETSAEASSATASASTTATDRTARTRTTASTSTGASSCTPSSAAETGPRTGSQLGLSGRTGESRPDPHRLRPAVAHHAERLRLLEAHVQGLARPAHPHPPERVAIGGRGGRLHPARPRGHHGRSHPRELRDPRGNRRRAALPVHAANGFSLRLQLVRAGRRLGARRPIESSGSPGPASPFTSTSPSRRPSSRGAASRSWRSGSTSPLTTRGPPGAARTTRRRRTARPRSRRSRSA